MIPIPLQRPAIQNRSKVNLIHPVLPIPKVPATGSVRNLTSRQASFPNCSENAGPLQLTGKPAVLVPNQRRKSLGAVSVLAFRQQLIPLIPPKEAIQHFVVSIVVSSNYGHPTDLSCSTIDILDPNNVPLKISKIEFDPEPIHITSTDSLLNGKMIKKQDDPDWRVQWNGKKLTLILSIESSLKPAGIRIWSGTTKDGSGIKDVDIFVNDVFANATTVPKNFGSVLSFPTVASGFTSTEIAEIGRAKRQAAADLYGIVPIKAVSKIEIICESTYEDHDFVGLGAIMIYNVAGKKLSLAEDILKLQLMGATMVTNPDRLFRDNPCQDVCNYLLSQKRPGEKPTIFIEFRKPQEIVMVKFINIVQASVEKNYCVKRLSVRMDGEFIRMMTLRNAAYHKHSGVDTYRIWCTESGTIRQKIGDIDQKLNDEE